jgi:hypothetical protein
VTFSLAGVIFRFYIAVLLVLTFACPDPKDVRGRQPGRR